ncbi:MAG: TauD/TfdA family dioxygenase [Acidimicrobiia bacterium]|nr:TauD/TfdA family dioxygenase [Acidimicrobiia bacterium]
MAAEHQVAGVVEALERRPEGLIVRFHGVPEPVTVPWRWVRDHGEDAASLDPATAQRLVDTFAIPADLAPSSAELAGATIRVTWAGDGAPPSVLSVARLAEAAGLLPLAGPGLWSADAPLPDGPPWFSHEAVSTDDRALLAWLEAIERLGFALVRGMPPTAEAAEALARRIGYPRATIFGPAMWTLSSAVADHEDSAYSTTFLEPHTDGTYTLDAPGLQLFACLERAGTGGDSILVDGFAAAERVRAVDPEAFALLSWVEVPSQYLEPGVHLRACRPVLRTNRGGRLLQVSFNNYDRAPFLLPPDEMERWYDAYIRLHAEVNDRRHWLTVGLEPGQVLVIDNWRILHGRMGYTGTRVFEGCYHNREDLDSRLRVLRSASAGG